MLQQGYVCGMRGFCWHFALLHGILRTMPDFKLFAEEKLLCLHLSPIIFLRQRYSV